MLNNIKQYIKDNKAELRKRAIILGGVLLGAAVSGVILDSLKEAPVVEYTEEVTVEVTEDFDTSE